MTAHLNYYRAQAAKTFTGRRSEVLELDPGYNGPPELGGAIHRLEEELAPLMILWSSQLGLLAHERRFGEMRDALTTKRPIWTTARDHRSPQLT